MNAFFKSTTYGIVGISKDPQKYGNKVALWYLKHKLPLWTVYGIHPKEAEVEGIRCYQDIQPSSDLSLSLITPPAVTFEFLQQLDNIECPVRLWCQPGSTDDECHSIIKDLLDKGHVETALYDGPCILRDSKI